MASITGLIQRKRNAGVIDIPSLRIPVNLTGDIRLVATLPTTDLEDAANQIRFDSWLSNDGVSGWEYLFGFTWSGGSSVGKDGQPIKGPWLSFNVDRFAGKHIKGQITLNRQMSIGFDIDN